LEKALDASGSWDDRGNHFLQDLPNNQSFQPYSSPIRESGLTSKYKGQNMKRTVKQKEPEAASEPEPDDYTEEEVHLKVQKSKSQLSNKKLQIQQD
jgi:hypothetical protein